MKLLLFESLHWNGWWAELTDSPLVDWRCISELKCWFLSFWQKKKNKPLDFGPDALTPCFCKGRRLHPQTTRRTQCPLRLIFFLFCFVLFCFFKQLYGPETCVCVSQCLAVFKKNAIQPRRLTHTQPFFFFFFTCVLCVIWLMYDTTCCGTQTWTLLLT